MIVAGSVFEGFKSQIADKVFGFWGHIHVTDLQVNKSVEPYLIQRADSIAEIIREADYSEMGLSEDCIERVEPFVILPGILDHKNLQEGLFLKGIAESGNNNFLSRFLKSGRQIEYSDSVFSRDVLISEQSALKAGIQIDDAVIAHFVLGGNLIKRKLKVAGIYRTGLEEYDKKFALVDIRLLQNLLSWRSDEVSGIEIFLKRIADADRVNAFLYEEVLPANLYAETIREKFPNIFEWLALQDINRSFILGLILLVCVINMTTTLLILILERTPMIGLLSALGMNTWNQRKIFIRYGVKILAVGLALGNVIGIGLCLIQWKWKLIKLSEADYYLDHAPIALDPLNWIILSLIFFVVVSFSLIIPSFIVSRMKPVNALKFR